MTVCVTLDEVLPLKLPSPAYTAVRVGEPAAVNVIAHDPAPALSVPVQLPPALAVTVTLPVGVPVPVTLKAITTAWLTVEGFGVFEVIAVALLALVAVVDWFFVGAAL